MKVAIHNGKFHADDVVAAAILKLIFPSIELIRTRDLELLKKSDMRVDVGGKYNHKTKDYDHHQADFKEVRQNGIPYASAGLIWKHYGEKLVTSKEVWKMIDDKLIQFIDADDMGVLVYEKKLLEPYNFPDLVGAFNPVWPNDQTEKAFNEGFNSVLEIAIKALQREIVQAESLAKAKKKIVALAKGKDYIVLDDPMPWKEIAITETKLKFVIKQDAVNKDWGAMAVPIAVGSFQNRKDFPASWAGLTDVNLAKVSGVSDAVFCHRKLFIAVAKSKEGAIKLVEKALKNEK